MQRPGRRSTTGKSSHAPGVVAPKPGTFIEVLWNLAGDSEFVGDEEWNPGGCEPRGTAEKFWWPAVVRQGKVRGTLDVVHTKSAHSCHADDLDKYLYRDVFFFNGNRLRFGPGRHRGMVANWRLCEWGDQYDKGDGLDGEYRAGVESELSALRAVNQSMAVRLSKLELELSGMRQVMAGFKLMYDNNCNNPSSSASKRLQTFLRIYVMNCLILPTTPVARRRRVSAQVLSQGIAVVSDVLQTQGSDCTMREFQSFIAFAIQKFGEKVSVTPSSLSVGFLSLRKGDVIKISFRTMKDLCDAVEMDNLEFREITMQTRKGTAGAIPCLRSPGFIFEKYTTSTHNGSQVDQ